MIQVSGLTKYYQQLAAVNNVSFELSDGEIVILVGPNGAGKSTLIKSIMGILRYDGTVLFDGADTRISEVRSKLGYVPEMPAPYPLLTVREHLEFAARLYGVENWQPFADELLERFDLADKADKLGSELSKGMQQKVGLCSTILHRPKLILFDEPMMGLDPYAIKALQKMFIELKEIGSTCMISTHILSSVGENWDRVLIMQDGQLKANVTKSDLAEMDMTMEDYFFKVTDLKQNDMGAMNPMSGDLSSNAGVEKPKRRSIFGGFGRGGKR